MLLSIIIPIFNEEKNIYPLFERLVESIQELPCKVEYFFINDGSSDASLFLIKKLSVENNNVFFIDFSRNFGHQLAICAGLQHCQGDRVVIIDGDLQDPPELIFDLYTKMNDGYEVVYAKRKKRHDETWLKKWTARFFYRLLTKITQINIPIDTGDFRIIDRKIVDILNSMPEQHKYLRGQIAWAGFKQTFIEYEREGRNHGKSKFTYSKMIKFALDGITSFSDFPLKFATISGFVVSGISFLVILYTLYSKYITQDYQAGWPSIMVSILFLGGIQLISIGIIGEYVSRIASNVKNRPLYLIRENNFKKINTF